MRQVTRKGLITVAAAGGVLATLSGGTAFADTASGSGALSGNTVNAPINVPIDVCGNTVSVLGSLNSAAACAPSSASGVEAPSAEAAGSDDIAAGNSVDVPVNAPVGVCGNSVSALGDGNAAGDCEGAEQAPPVEEPDNPGPEEPGEDEDCEDEPGPDNPGPDNPGPDDEGSGEEGGSDDSSGVTPASDVRTQSEPSTDQLAHTGAGDMIGIGAPLSAGLLIGGFVLYRRASRLARR